MLDFAYAQSNLWLLNLLPQIRRHFLGNGRYPCLQALQIYV